MRRLVGDAERARRVGQALATQGLVEHLISVDPQMAAVREIIGRMGFEDGALFIAGVALVSYMLSMRGEEHWLLAASYAGQPLDEALYRFVSGSPSLARLREQRLARVRAFLSAAAELRELLRADEVDLDGFHRRLVEALALSWDSKTAAFAAKMVLYSCLAAERAWRGGWSVPMPIDYRAALVSLTSGMLRGWSCGEDLLSLASRARSAKKSELLRLWRRASEEAGVPPVVLDSAVWVPGGCIESHLRRAEALESCIARLVGRRESFLRALSELWAQLEACSREQA